MCKGQLSSTLARLLSLADYLSIWKTQHYKKIGIGKYKIGKNAKGKLECTEQGSISISQLSEIVANIAIYYCECDMKMWYENGMREYDIDVENVILEKMWWQAWLCTFMLTTKYVYIQLHPTSLE